MKTNCDIIDKKIKDLTSEGLMFTSYDITRLLRNEGYEVSHYKLNKFVKNKFNNGEMEDYEKDIVDVGSSVLPTLYYHKYSDPNLYDKDWSLQKSIGEKSPNPDLKRNSSNKNKDLKISICLSGIGERISIPRDMLEKIGLSNGDEASLFYFVDPANSKNNKKSHYGIFIVNNNDPNIISNKSFKVLKDGRVRIPKKYIIRYLNKDNINISIEDNKIVLI